ncbi:hypothetical protein Q9R29_08540 [Rothia sp. ARF10]|nr:hypothetical protein [Rothia sp. ARF10]
MTSPPDGSVWLLWEWPFLRGLYASRDDAEDVADALRAKWVKRAPFTYAVNVWVEEQRVHTATRTEPDPARAQVRVLTDQIAKQWGLVSPRDVKAPEMFAVERFLVVPHNGRLVFPAFQFGPGGRPIDAFVAVLSHLRDAGWDDVAIATWFATGNEFLNGHAPADTLADRGDAVATAARTATRP